MPISPLFKSLFYGTLVMVLASCSAASQSTQPVKSAVRNPVLSTLRLTDHGHSKYVIALAKDAIPSERTAASELREYIAKVSGVKLAIKDESAISIGAPQILVGAGSRVKSLLPKQNWPGLGKDGIVIKTVGQNLILAGGRPRGSLYAVYTFLEDNLGVRWWTETESTVPTKKTIHLKPQNISYAPQLKTREAFYFPAKWEKGLGQGPEPYFGARLKLNGHFQHQGPELGGHYSNLGWSHTSVQLLPPEKYFKDHPEWYSDPANGGKPCTAASAMPPLHTWNLCLTNDEARKELTKNALEWIRAHPEAGMISITQNDTDARCTCPADAAMEKAEGSPSGPLLHFVNKVADDIEKEYPDFLVETLAYWHTLKPPRTIRPRKNVVMTLCSNESDFSQPLNSEKNKAFRDSLLAWKTITPRIVVWDYLANFSNMILPQPNMRTMGENIRFFVSNNAIGLFEQGDAYSNGTGDFGQLRAWLLAHLMWNPKLEQRKLESDFLHGYYGAAAPHLRQYLDTIQQGFLKTGGKLSFFQDDSSWLTLDLLTTTTEQFRKAATAVSGDSVLSDRVRRERLALDHAWILRYRELRLDAERRHAAFTGPSDLAAFTKDFVQTAQRFHAKQYTETRQFDAYAQQILARAEPSSPLPAFARDKNENDIIDVQESSFRLFGDGTQVSIVDDAKASNGRAARMPGSSFEWAIQYTPVESEEFLKDGPWHCYMLARVEGKPGVVPGLAMAAGIYDTKNTLGVAKVAKTLDEMGDGDYKIIDLGVHKIHSKMAFYAASPKRDDIESVLVDRIIMVRERK
jgi:hypothetical protein